MNKKVIIKEWDELSVIPVIETKVTELSSSKTDILISEFELDVKTNRLYLVCDSLTHEELEKGSNSVFYLHLSEFDSLDEGLNTLYDSFFEKLLNGGVYQPI